MTDGTNLLSRTLDYFQQIHRDVFLGDPAANPRLKVEVVDAGMADDTPVLVLVTPWTLNGLAFPPDGLLPDKLSVGGKRAMVLSNHVEAIGDYHSATLVADVSALGDHDAAVSIARSLAGHFRDAVAAARESQAVADPARRRLLRGGRGID